MSSAITGTWVSVKTYQEIVLAFLDYAKEHVEFEVRSMLRHAIDAQLYEFVLAQPQ